MFNLQSIKSATLTVSVICTTLGLSIFGGANPSSAANVCPSVGLDTNCGLLLTATGSGVTVVSTGQPVYDGVEDTLVGFINNTNQVISSLNLQANTDIFGFDGDGINAYGIPGNSLDTTGYGGPNSYFSNINPLLTAGTVNFINPIAPGGTAYFSLEEALTSANFTTAIVATSVPEPTSLIGILGLGAFGVTTLRKRKQVSAVKA